MADEKPPLSPAMQRLAQGMKAFGKPTRLVNCGFKLWIEIMGSGHTTMCNFNDKGEPADGSEPEGALIVPMLVLSRHTIFNFDPTLEPENFELKG